MSRVPSTLRVLYTLFAPLYDRLVPSVSARARTLGKRWLQVQNGEQILDVGTGTGLALRDLVAANPSGWTEGVDITPAMLARAYHRLADCDYRRYGLRCGTATSLPYPDNAFDAVFSSYTIDVLPPERMRPALQEIHRVLHPTGRLVLVYMAPPSRPIERVWEELARCCPVLLGGDRPVDLRSLLDGTGFAIQRHTTRTQLALRSAIVRALPK